MTSLSSVAVTSKALTPVDALVSAVSAVVSGFHDKTLHLLTQRSDIEKGSEALRGYLESTLPDELSSSSQLEPLVAKIAEKSMSRFQGDIEALQVRLTQAKSNLFLAKFCFTLFDQILEFDLILTEFRSVLEEADALKDNPFGLGDVPNRLKSLVEKMFDYLTRAKAEATAHKIIFSEKQSESLERGVALINHMKKQISARAFLSSSFRGFDLTLSARNTFYHNLPVLDLQRKCNQAISLTGGSLEEALAEIARMIAGLDRVLRVKIEDTRPKVVKEEIPVTSMELEEAEVEREQLYLKAEIASYKTGLESALTELSEYKPLPTQAAF